MKANPHLISGWNKYWIRFFLVAVFATMCVRDHARPDFHKALGVDIEQYDRKVLQTTSEISRQIFPIELDLDHPAWERGLKKLRRAFEAMEAGQRQGGPIGWLRKSWSAVRAASAFTGLYLIPVKKNALPASPRLEPSY